ncbi:MAG: hypothetical protein U5N55_11310 [Cypionkella sp.]|nr:hypothetical protein [Cypionkella sp.]
MTDDAARALVDARPKAPQPAAKATPNQDDIVAYCRAQIAQAQSEEERRAAQRLVSHLIEQGLHPAT